MSTGAVGPGPAGVLAYMVNVDVAGGTNFRLIAGMAALFGSSNDI